MDIEYTFKAGNQEYSAFAIFTDQAPHKGWYPQHEWGRYIPGIVRVMIFKNYTVMREDKSITAGDYYTNIDIYMSKFYTKQMLMNQLQNDLEAEFLKKSRDIKISQILEKYKELK